MYTRLADKLTVVGGTDLFSEAVDMAGANAGQVEYTVLHWSGTGTMTVSLQDGNDRENWKATLGTLDGGGGGTATGVGYNHFKVSEVAAQNVRVKYSLTSGTAVVSLGINTALL